MITIANDKRRIDWHSVRAEYINGASQRSLAEKYGVSRTAVERRVRLEGWAEEREKAKAEVVHKIIQKTAEKAADNASLVADAKRKSLLLINQMLDDYIANAATSTERRITADGITDVKRIRDLTAALKDLTDDMPKATAQDIEDLTPLVELLRDE